jgi:D-glycero-D-manno-heptose 1,7-bisphosphate phosphatase
MATFDVDMEKSYVVGDRYTDIEMAHRCGLRAILVMTGYGMGDLEYVIPQCQFKPNHIAANLQEAVNWILDSDGMGAS